MKFKKGDATYLKCVGFGYTTFEEGPKVERVSRGKVWLKDGDYPFDAETGIQISDLPSLGLTVTLCVSDADISRAEKELAEEAV